MDYDDANTRPRWSNVQTSEQHFGMLGFLRADITIDGKMDDWKGYAPVAKNDGQAIYMTSDEAYLYVRIDRKSAEPDRRSPCRRSRMTVICKSDR